MNQAFLQNIEESIFKINDELYLETIKFKKRNYIALNKKDGGSCSSTICCGVFINGECKFKNTVRDCISYDDYIKLNPEIRKIITLKLEEEYIKSL